MTFRSFRVNVYTLLLSVVFASNSIAQDEFSETFTTPSRPIGVPGAIDREFTVEGERSFLFPEGANGRNGSGAFFRAEYLNLKPRRRSLDFVIVDPVDQGAEIPEGSIESLEWERRSGLRFGAGYVLPSSQWDIGFLYTYLHSNDQRTVTAPDGGTLLATMTRPGAIDEVTTANAHAGLDYDVLDFELGKRVVQNGWSTVRLFGGPRLAWIDQKFSANYDGNTAVQANVQMPLFFDGYGMRLGGEAHYFMGGGFSLFGRASGSLLIGDFRTSLRETNSDGATLISSLTEKYEKVVPVTDLGVGLSWQRNRLRLSLGYEFSNWFGMVESRDFVDDWHEGRMSTRTSNLSLDGFFFQMAIVR